tara:strand:+ start:105 stop:869 length:765 start_codon:yes stop_codon:yes gene_type:complete
MKKTYFNHDSTARNDYRIIKMRAKLGMEAYGIFWSVLEMLFTEENKLCIDDYDSLAFGLQCDAKVLKQVIEDFDLFVIEDNCFYSRRLNKHIEEINTKSVKAKENAKKRWNNATVMQPQCNRNASKSISKSISKVNKSKIQDRIVAFKNAVHNLDFMNKEDKEDFYLYWSELTKSQTNPRMRWETERTWSLNLRAKRWINNGFNKQKSRFPDHYDSLLMKRLDVSAQKEYEQHLKNLGYVTEYNPNAGAKWVKR